jgi:hypothetical protein
MFLGASLNRMGMGQLTRRKAAFDASADHAA